MSPKPTKKKTAPEPKAAAKAKVKSVTGKAAPPKATPPKVGPKAVAKAASAPPAAKPAGATKPAAAKPLSAKSVTAKPVTAKPITKKAAGKAPAKGSAKARAAEPPAKTKAKVAAKKPVVRTLTKKDFEHFRRMLVERKDELTEAYKVAKGDSRREIDNGTEDYIDYAVNSYAKEFLLSLSEMDRKQILLVQDALRRIDRGEYGLCLQCGQEILRKRLEVAPWARHCVRCQELEERGLLPRYVYSPEGEELHTGALGLEDEEFTHPVARDEEEEEPEEEEEEEEDEPTKPVLKDEPEDGAIIGGDEEE